MSLAGRVCTPALHPVASPVPISQRRDVRVRALKKNNRDEEKKSGVSEFAALMGVASVMSPQVAKADEVDAAVGAAKGAIETVGEYVRILLDLFNTGANTAKEGYEVAAPVVKDVYGTVAPIVSSGVSGLKEAAGPAISAAAPTVEEGAKGAESFLAGQGINVEVIKSGAGTAAKTTGDVVTAATPAAKSAFSFLTTTDPLILGEYGLALLGIYLFGPALLGIFFDSLRGFAGTVSPPFVLDAVVANGDAYLVDLRSQVEKERSGVPDLPPGASRRYIELPVEPLSSKMKGQLRNPQDVEYQVTALQISALKKLNKGCTVYLLDKNGSSSTEVAKEVARRGFKNCFVVQGGYSGWTQSKLQVKPSSTVARAEVIAPVLGTIFGTGSTRTKTQTVSTRTRQTVAIDRRRALPPGK